MFFAVASFQLMVNIQKMCYIALGSNIGNPVQQIALACKYIEQIVEGSIVKSSLWKSDPVDCPAGSPCFLNAVVGGAMPENLSAMELLDRLQRIEVVLGRSNNHGVNQPRTIDLDILYFRGETIESPRLKVPHPRALLRRFVVEPWAEIAPQLVFSDPQKPLDAPKSLRCIAETLRKTTFQNCERF